MSQYVENRKITLITSGGKGGYLHIPLNILYVAESLILHGYEPNLVDLRVRDLLPADIEGSLFVGVSLMSGSMQVPPALKSAEMAKSMGIPVVFGGAHASILPEQTAAHALVDVAVKGDGEDVIIELAEYFQKKRELHSIKGIAFKENTGDVIFTGDRIQPGFARITHLPYNLLQMEKYSATQADFDYQTSRGCPHRCAFCGEVSIFNRRWRMKPVSSIVVEIERIIEEFNPQRIYFVDSNFFCNRKRVKEFCDQVIARNIKTNFFAECRFDYFAGYDNNFIETLKKAGFNEIEFGGESGSDETLAYIRKDITREDILGSIKKCKEAGIKSFTSFMVGFPGETDEQIKETLEIYDRIRSIDKTGARINGMFVFSPFPGTALFEEAVNNYDFKAPVSLNEWANFELYDSANISWIGKNRKRKLQTISTIVRFFFVYQTLIDWTWEERIKRHRGVLKAFMSTIFNSCIYPLALVRWKTRFFGFDYDIRFWQRVFYGFMGRK
ncbi:MAG: B12-binding domain-containing radical SAM protein [Bacteroidetes bacterium]|nr:B12-binding domain-containing radical SAM protein [Bacteroidota bacterium]